MIVFIRDDTRRLFDTEVQYILYNGCKYIQVMQFHPSSYYAYYIKLCIIIQIYEDRNSR